MIEQLIQIATLAGLTIGVVVVIRKEQRDTEKHQWEREDRTPPEL